MLLLNGDDLCVADHLDRLARRSSRIDVAVSYLTDAERLVRWARRYRTVNVLIALVPPTNPAAVKRLMDVRLPNLGLRFLGSDFHAKVILFYKGTTPFAASVGSSNMTQGGLRNNTEANVAVSDRQTLSALANFCGQMWRGALSVEPDDLKKLTAVTRKWPRRATPQTRADELGPRDFHRPTRPTKEARDYLAFWRCVDEIRDSVRLQSRRAWPKLAVYTAIDHFWHWLKYECTSIRRDQRRMASDVRYRRKRIPVLFAQYVSRMKAKSPSEYRETVEEIEYTQGLTRPAKLRSLTRPGALDIYRSIYSGAGAERRFGKGKYFVKYNDIAKIRRALYHLLWNDSEDIAWRIHDVLAGKSPMRLYGVGRPIAMELLGWVRPDKYPPGNDKAYDGMELLGYRFR